MNASIKRTAGWILALAMCLCLILFSPTAYADTDGTELQVTTQPDKLVIQLGAEWAGVEFELRTDTGLYPQPIIVSDEGILSMELGGSKTYTLSALNSSVASPIPEDADGDSTPVEGTNTEGADGQETEAPPTTAPESTAQPADPEEPIDPEETDESVNEESSLILGIPNKHLFLFAGGLLICIIALVVMWVLKRRRSYRFEEDDDYYGDDYDE